MLKYVNSAYALWMTLRLTCGVFQVLVCCYSWGVSSFFKHWVENKIWDLKFREKKSGKPFRSRKRWLPSRLILWDLFWFSLQNFRFLAFYLFTKLFCESHAKNINFNLDSPKFTKNSFSFVLSIPCIFTDS